MIPTGLTMKQVKELTLKYGKNEITSNNRHNFIQKVIHILSEPIYLLLSIAAIIYFILGEATDGVIMIAFVLIVIGSNAVQELRTGRTLSKLKKITTPGITVIREGKKMIIPSEELVPGDVMLISEGVKIPADGYLIYSSGLVIDESILTGEAEGVPKYAFEEGITAAYDEKLTLDNTHYCYTGTLVILGYGIVIVTKTGNDTEYGKITSKLRKVNSEYTPLQAQMRKLASQCTIFAAVLFLAVATVTFVNLIEYPNYIRWIQSILAGTVLALSMVPGEFPVIQSVFLTMGALRLTKKNALVRSLPSVETLGSITVLCLDKTGTITQNTMTVQEYWALDSRQDRLCRSLTLACKKDTRDPMELAMLSYGERLCCECKQQNKLVACSLNHGTPVLVKEYAFTNESKAMGQVWSMDNSYMIAVKGSPETVISLCMITKEQEKVISAQIKSMTQAGLRVIAVADRILQKQEDIPECLSQCSLYLRGFLGLLDPPRDHIEEDIQACYQAGIRIVMITGDHPLTARAIADRVGMISGEKIITGDELSVLNDEELREVVKECNIFARVLPLHKLRIVKALKENGEIVAMTGDGVNDSPAQKMASIGIAMGKHGCEVSREAADLILLDDNFTTILDSIRDGRRIYHNIRKAIGYVFAIHIPIALLSLIVPMLGIPAEALFLLPLHIVILELVMDPTCSIALEHQPAEDDIMLKPPRRSKEALLTGRLFLKSILQGIMIFAGSFLVYYGLLITSHTPQLSRTAGFSTLVLANILLVFVNCSDHEGLPKILNKLKKDVGIWLVNLITLLCLIGIIYSPFNSVFAFTKLPLPYVLLIIAVSAASVLWYEVVKLFKRRRKMFG